MSEIYTHIYCGAYELIALTLHFKIIFFFYGKWVSFQINFKFQINFVGDLHS